MTLAVTMAAIDWTTVEVQRADFREFRTSNETSSTAPVRRFHHPALDQDPVETSST
jgi:hypothetical protein